MSDVKVKGDSTKNQKPVKCARERERRRQHNRCGPGMRLGRDKAFKPVVLASGGLY
jgi:hypothetical protein